HVVFGQTGLVVVDQRDDVAAGDVAVVDDGEALRVEVAGDARDRSARNRGANRPTVEESGDGDVVDVARGARDLFGALLAASAATHGAGAGCRGGIINARTAARREWTRRRRAPNRPAAVAAPSRGSREGRSRSTGTRRRR